MVCFWYDLSAAWKIDWKRDSEEDAVVACIGDISTIAVEDWRGIVDGLR